MSDKKEACSVQKDKKDVLQALVVVNPFEDEFRPISDDIHVALIPVVNKPIIEYTLEFLHLGGVDETFLFCTTQIDVLRAYVKESQSAGKNWAVAMKVSVVASETCSSFGDCLRDIDSKGLIRGNFILLESGVISNMKLLPIIQQHIKHVKHDKGTAMTMIYQETTVRQVTNYPLEMMIVAINDRNKILAHKKCGLAKDSDKVDFPIEIFLEHSPVNIRHDFRDTHVSICSPSVLPLFADNFDYQTKDDLIRGILMNEEILESSLYCHVLEGGEYGSAVSNWRMYQIMSYEVAKFWMYPLTSCTNINYRLRNNIITGTGTKIPEKCTLRNVIIGDNVQIGENVELQNCFVFSNCAINNNVKISSSVIGSNCIVKENSVVENGSILGSGVVIEKDATINNNYVIAKDDADVKKLSDNAYIIVKDADSDNDSDQCDLMEDAGRLLNDIHKFDMSNEQKFYEIEDLSESDEEELSYTESPVPGDTELFFTEVVDSLTRGFEDKVLCDNLILEVNSSRYAYNVTLREVNFYVVRAILHMSVKNNKGKPIIAFLNSLLSYFHPLLSNYIRCVNSREDCLKAIEDVSTTYENITDKWVILAIRWLYDKEHLTEDAIMKWHSGLNRSTKLHNYVKPIIEWLQEAEEISEESSED